MEEDGGTNEQADRLDSIIHGAGVHLHAIEQRALARGAHEDVRAIQPVATAIRELRKEVRRLRTELDERPPTILLEGADEDAWVYTEEKVMAKVQAPAPNAVDIATDALDAIGRITSWVLERFAPEEGDDFPAEARDAETVRQAIIDLLAEARRTEVFRASAHDEAAAKFQAMQREAARMREVAELDGALARLEEHVTALLTRYEEAQTVITEQHGKLWAVGLDTHEGEPPISDADAIKGLLALRAGDVALTPESAISIAYHGDEQELARTILEVPMIPSVIEELCPEIVPKGIPGEGGRCQLPAGHDRTHQITLAEGTCRWGWATGGFQLDQDARDLRKPTKVVLCGVYWKDTDVRCDRPQGHEDRHLGGPGGALSWPNEEARVKVDEVAVVERCSASKLWTFDYQDDQRIFCELDVGHQGPHRAVASEQFPGQHRFSWTNEADWPERTPAEAIFEIVPPEIEHRPRLTDDGNPAHGCETCDGDDVCTCPHKNYRARCLGCGGRWPECMNADPPRRPCWGPGASMAHDAHDYEFNRVVYHCPGHAKDRT